MTEEKKSATDAQQKPPTDAGETVETLKATIAQAKKEAAETKAELDKQLAIKAELIAEREKRAKGYQAVTGEKSEMEQQLAKIQEARIADLARLEALEKETTHYKGLSAKAEAKTKQELDSLIAIVPEEKKTLLSGALAGKDNEGQLEFIKANAKFLLGVEVPAVFPLPAHRPAAAPQNNGLTSEEKALAYKRGMPLDVAEAAKLEDPEFFIKHSKKK